MTASVAPGASNIEIVIIISLGADAHEYNARRDEVGRVRPKCCPGCGGTHLGGHGWYGRWAIYFDQDVWVEIHRFLCKGCRKTLSLLPDFLHRHRHYALAMIEAVLRGRLEQGLPWSRLAPSQRSVRRWLGAFVTQAIGWQTALLSALAQVQPLAGVLDPHGRESSAALAVLLLGAVFAAWLDPEYLAATALRAVWRWGWNSGVGRLV